jgi:hypothetical protein
MTFAGTGGRLSSGSSVFTSPASARTATSVPELMLPNTSSNARCMLSLSISVPARNATPSAMEVAVRKSRSLCASIPLIVALNIPHAPRCFM